MSQFTKIKESAEAVARHLANPTLLEPPDVRAKCRRRTMALVRTGRLVREPCEGCGSDHVQAHHENYRRPGYVRWLCHLCHHAVHRRGLLLRLKLPDDPTDDEIMRWICGGLFRGLALAADAADKHQAAPTPTLFLTLAEAAEVSGLSQAYVRRLIEAGTLAAVKDRGWRIRRRDLEAR